MTDIIKRGDVIHRATECNQHIHNFLKHLEHKNINSVPKFLGMDNENREMLSYIPGTVLGNDYPIFEPYIWSESTLVTIANILRIIHDASVDFIAYAVCSKWETPYFNQNQYEVICHNDAALYNFVFQDEKPVALIDFDTAYPAPRLWDMAYTLYTTIPLASFSPDYQTGTISDYLCERDASDRKRKISLFFQAYGIDMPNNLCDWITRRLKAMCDFLLSGAERGDMAITQMVKDGHLTHYENEIIFLSKHFVDWL